MRLHGIVLLADWRLVLRCARRRGVDVAADGESELYNNSGDPAGGGGGGLAKRQRRAIVRRAGANSVIRC